jgi:hypothetical protein
MSVAADGTVTRDEEAVLASIDRYLARGLDLKRWWDRACAAETFTQRFPLTTSYNRPDESFGFFGTAEVEGRAMPVMGNYQTMFYDQPKAPGGSEEVAARWLRDQVREFVLHYFMRVSGFRLPEAYIPPGGHHRPLPRLLRPLSWCPEEDPALVGFGFSQIFSREKGAGRIGIFPPEQRKAIVDLREIGTKYDWIVPWVDIFDFKFVAQPFGPGTPSLSVPLSEGSYLVVTRDFILDENDPDPHVLGRYGFGYSFIKNPGQSLLGYGPGEFDAAIEMINFHVYRDGRIRAEAVFVVNQPTRILNVPLNPLDWAYGAARLASLGTASYFLAPLQNVLHAVPGTGLSIDPVRLSLAAANLLTGGLASRRLCVSFEQLEKDFLVTHFKQHYQTLVGSLQTWRQIADWLDTAALPDWVKTGRIG